MRFLRDSRRESLRNLPMVKMVRISQLAQLDELDPDRKLLVWSVNEGQMNTKRNEKKRTRGT